MNKCNILYTPHQCELIDTWNALHENELIYAWNAFPLNVFIGFEYLTWRCKLFHAKEPEKLSWQKCFFLNYYFHEPEDVQKES